MKILTHRINYSYGDKIEIIPVFDVHYGNKWCDIKSLITYLEEHKGAYIIGGGDLLDSITIKDFRYRKSADGNKEGDDVIDQQVKKMVEILMPYRDRIIGLATGNHEDTITEKCGTNPTKRMCEALGCEFLGYSGLIKIVMSETNKEGKKSRTRTVVVRYHHGWGGGSRTQGADLTKYSKDLVYWDADIFMYGHVHRRQSDRVPRLGLSGEKLVSKPKIILICGTYLKTYSDNTDPTYSEKAGYPPIEIGGLSFTIQPTSKWVKIAIND